MDIRSNNQIQQAIRSVSTLLVETYTWLLAVTFGMTLLDILYARVLRTTNAAVDPAAVFSEVTDLLLWIGGVTLLAAVVAIGSSWKSPAARYFYIASLLVVIGGSIIPFAIFLIFPNSALATRPGAGWWLRLSISGIASLLAFLGLRAFHRQR